MGVIVSKWMRILNRLWKLSLVLEVNIHRCVCAVVSLGRYVYLLKNLNVTEYQYVSYHDSVKRHLVTCKWTNEPATVSEMLAEDSGFLGQRQRIILHVPQILGLNARGPRLILQGLWFAWELSNPKLRKYYTFIKKMPENPTKLCWEGRHYLY